MRGTLLDAAAITIASVFFIFVLFCFCFMARVSLSYIRRNGVRDTWKDHWHIITLFLVLSGMVMFVQWRLWGL